MQFDPTNVPQHDDAFEPLPAAWYHAIIIGAEPHLGKKPAAGEMLKLSVEIDADEHPQYANRKLFSYLCVNHQNDMPRNIARRHLSTICHALDLFPMEDESDLIGAKIMVKLKVREADGNYDASNDIASWAACDEPEAKPMSRAVKKIVDKFDGEIISDPRPTETPARGVRGRGWRK